MPLASAMPAALRSVPHSHCAVEASIPSPPHSRGTVPHFCDVLSYFSVPEEVAVFALDLIVNKRAVAAKASNWRCYPAEYRTSSYTVLSACLCAAHDGLSRCAGERNNHAARSAEGSGAQSAAGGQAHQDRELHVWRPGPPAWGSGARRHRRCIVAVLPDYPPSQHTRWNGALPHSGVAWAIDTFA